MIFASGSGVHPCARCGFHSQRAEEPSAFGVRELPAWGAGSCLGHLSEICAAARAQFALFPYAGQLRQTWSSMWWDVTTPKLCSSRAGA